ncbi:MAG: hypothetical protein ABIJ61_09020, partial [bacterium]
MKTAIGLFLLPLTILVVMLGCSGEEAGQAEPETTPRTEGQPPSGAETSGTFRIYGFESAIIEYSVTSAIME